MAEETHYTAKMGIAVISAANSNLDGSGTTYSLISGGSNGTLIKSLMIKATDDTSEGMVRFFIHNGSRTYLFLEVEIPTITRAASTLSFETQITLNFKLESGHTMYASTQNADTFNVFAEGMDWSYYASEVRPDTTQLFPKSGTNNTIVANTNLDGTGSHTDVITAGSGATYKGLSVKTITIKAIDTTRTGMIRLFINNGETDYLFTELQIPVSGSSGLDELIEKTIEFEDDLDLGAGYKITATTQLSESWRVGADGLDWNYVA